MIRIAAIGDVHFGPDAKGTMKPHLDELSERADMLLLAGDLTRHGAAEEAEAFVEELRDVVVPVVSVLGNHDHHCGQQDRIRSAMESVGVTVLEGSTTVIDVNGTSVGIAGVKGFGGGFAGACGSDFGEPEMKAFVRHTIGISHSLRRALSGLDSDVKIALLHYSPTAATLKGERLEIYPFLGSYLLAEAIDESGADLVLHGHAHAGTEKGVTPGGIEVRNVAQPLLRCPYGIYCLDPVAPDASLLA